jgi:hypothetical protein
MPTEQERADLTAERGRQAAQITDPIEKKAYIAGSAGVDTDFEGTQRATSAKGNELQRKSILGSQYQVARDARRNG